jgi:hypothetical protein
VEYGFLSGLGLTSSAGLNAYIPLLVLALADRFSNQVTLAQPYDFLSSTIGIIIIIVLLTIEIAVDKVPGIDHMNDLLQSAIRPASGGILMMSTTHDTVHLNPALAMILGLLIAGGVHAAKALSRPVITISTAGLGNPIISMVEDGVAIITSIIAVIFPLIVIAAIIVFGALLFWAYRLIRRFNLRSSRHPSSPPQTLRQ